MRQCAHELPLLLQSGPSDKTIVSDDRSVCLWHGWSLNNARMMLAACFSILLIPYLSLLKQLVHDLIFLFGIAIVLQGFGVVVHRALMLAAQGIDLCDAVIGPRIFLIALERPVEGISRLL